jgi:bifunctional DNase/RNase
MKCLTVDCQKEAVIYIVEVRDRRNLPQKPLCERHAVDHLPFCEPNGGRISIGTGLFGALSRFELRFVVFFGEHFFSTTMGEGLYFREVIGSKRFCTTVTRDAARSILLTMERGVGPRLFTFPAFAKILETLGAKLEEVVFDEIDPKENYLHAKLKLRQGDRLIDVDVEPSDAVALAIACGVPILITDAVFARAEELGWT